MEAALTFFISLGRIEIVPFVRKSMMNEIGFQLRVLEVKDRADFQGSKVRINSDDVQLGSVWILNFSKCGNPDRRGKFSHSSLEWFKLHEGAEFFETLLIFGGGDRTID